MSGAFNNAFNSAFNLYTFNIVEDELPIVRSNQPYNQQLEASDPATWVLQVGALPSGITLSSSGLLSGVSTALGSYDVTFRATSIAISYIDDWMVTINVASDGTITFRRRSTIFYHNFFGRRI